MYDPTSNPRSLAGEVEEDRTVEGTIAELQANLAILERAKSLTEQDEWKNIVGSAQEEINVRIVRILRSAESWDEVQRLRGEIEGLTWVTSLAARIETERETLMLEVEAQQEFEEIQVGARLEGDE